MISPSELLEDWAPKAPGRRALVLGAGGGAEVAWLVQEGFKVDAVERDPLRVRALAQATSGMPVSVHQQDVEALDIPPERYALVVALAVLHFVPPSGLRRLADQISVGLEPGGLLLVQVLTDADSSADGRRRRGDLEPAASTFELEGEAGLVHYFAKGELVGLFPALLQLEHEVYRFVAGGRPGGFGEGEILVAEKAASAGS